MSGSGSAMAIAAAMLSACAHAGLFDAEGEAKPALAAFKRAAR